MPTKSIIALLALLASFLPPLQAQDFTPEQLSQIHQLEEKALYHPRLYDPEVIQAFIREGGKRIPYRTDDGEQSAWLIVPEKPAPGGHLWLVCGGNAALALEMAPLCRALSRGDAWLLVDYPGYGECKGSASPAGIRNNIKAAVPLAAEALKLDPKKLPERLAVFGHSLGCAAALIGAEEFHAKTAILCAPFTSSTDMARRLLPLPPGVPFKHLYDNRKTLAALRQQGGSAWLIHGQDDEVIPVSMSEQLAKEFKECTRLVVIPKAKHNDLFSLHQKEIGAVFMQASSR